MFNAVKELSDQIQEKADLVSVQELQDKKDQMNETILQLQVELQQKADKLEAQVSVSLY